MDTIFSHPEVLMVIVGLPLIGIVARLLKVPFSRIARWYLYITVFAAVIVMDSIFFPFIGGKDYFFRYAVELALACFILWWAFEAKKGEIRALLKDAYKKPIVRAVTVFVSVYLLACLFAFDVHAAFWSNYERGEGGFQMLHYYVFFMLLVLLLRTEREWKNIFGYSLVAAGAMIVYGLLGDYSVAGFIGPYAAGSPPNLSPLCTLLTGRFEGTLGNPAYVAPYLIFSMFYAAYLWVARKRDPRAAGGSGGAKLVSWGFGVLIFVFFVFFLLSQTRGAFLGLGVALFVLLVYLLLRGTPYLKKWALVSLILLVLIGGIGYFAVQGKDPSGCFGAARLFQINALDATAQTRFWTWGSAWRGFLERPILGWGPENFTTIFDKYFDPRHFVPGTQTETWFDRAHSVFFDYISETGILGLVSYLLIFCVLGWGILKRFWQSDARGSTTDILEHALILAVPVAYLVQGIAIFDVLPMYINLFLFAAFAYYYFHVHAYEHHG